MKKIIVFLVTLVVLLQGLTIVFAEEVSFKNGDIIEFGYYPQTKVDDNNLIQKLDKVQKEWKSFDYCYSKAVPGDKDNTDLIVMDNYPSDHMQYSDFSYNGINYRGVNFVRPILLASSMHWPDSEMYPDLTRGEFNGIYYFRYEPISWIVVDESNGILISQKALDQQEFNKSYFYDSKTDKYYSDSNKTSYANDYSEATLREWLNDDFISTAFSVQQAEIILKKEYVLDEYNFIAGSYLPTGKTVNDKISVASSTELREYDLAPIMATDYACTQGSLTKAVLTRTAFDKIVDDGGNVEAIGMENFDGQSMCFVNNVGGCIVPVMKLKDIPNENSMNLFDSGKRCECICHSLHHTNNILGQLFYKIIRTFWNWFSISEYCDCGLRHY